MRVAARLPAAALVSLLCAGLMASSACRSEPRPGGTPVVVAAASSVAPALIDSLDRGALGRLDATIDLTTGASSVLARQVAAGAPVGVFVSADRALVMELADAGVVTEMGRLVGNELVVAVRSDADVVGELADLARSDISVGVCDEAVPCGAYAREAIAAGGLAPNIVTSERNVGSLTQKLLAGELDAGFVYATDVAAHPEELTALPLPVPADVDVSVWVGLVDGAGADAEEAYRALLGPAVRAELLDRGFVS